MTNLLKGNEVNRNINQFWWLVAGNYFLGEVSFQLGNYPEAISYYANSIAALENKKVMPSWLILNKVAMLRAKVFAGEHFFDLASLSFSIIQNKIKIQEGTLNRYMAEILMNANPSYFSKSEDWIIKAISADAKNKMRWHLGLDYAFYAEFFKKKGDLAQAKEKLGKAIELMRDIGADGWVKSYEEELARL